MHWADRIAKEIIASGKYKPYWVDDMKTPSGRVHIGSVRAALTHELIYRSLKDLGKNVTFSYVLEDHDPMDGLPVYVDQEEYKKHLGKPLYAVPSPDPGYKSFGERWGNEYIEVFNKIGVHPKIIWGSELYRSGKMNDMVRVCLDKAELIRGIYKTLYGKGRPKDWFPFQIVCEKCGKLSTTVVYNWDGELVSYKCKIDGLEWTKGCGNEGKVSPFSTEDRIAGKLPWKVEWPCKWKVIGVTVEGAGKDHMSAGSSHDFAKLVCKKVLGSEVPYHFSHEFFLVGGRKMSSSKGLGSSAKEVSEIIPPYLVRFMIAKVKFNEQINFDPVGTMAIPDLFDDYDKAWEAYNDGGEEKLMRMFVLSQIAKPPQKEKGFFVPRFRDVANYLSQGLSESEIVEKISEIKGGKIDDSEYDVLLERVKYAKVWLSGYAPHEYRFEITEEVPEAVKNLTDEQKKYLEKIPSIFNDDETAENLQIALYELAKEAGLSTKDAFEAIYKAFINKTHGPRAGMLLVNFGRDKVTNRVKGVLGTLGDLDTQTVNIKTLSKPEYFVIDKEVKNVFTSATIGIALIEGVNINKTDSGLEKEKEKLLSSLEGLTTETLGEYPEIKAYRELYKEMGVDWHSRRPSPEALLRRVALGKGLYTINTVVDAYNLVVMKNRVSVGAFDADNIEFPTMLRFAKAGEEILLLGDEKPTRYTSKELAYFDKKGGYNIDFNYRDAQRTMVAVETKNLWINVDGVYEVSPEMVQRTLDEAIVKIIKYAGGEVRLKGMVA